MGSTSAVLGAFLFVGRAAEFAPQLLVQGHTRTHSNTPSDHHDQPSKARHHNQCLLINSKPIQARATHKMIPRGESWLLQICLLVQ
jgi:hypothetical protein